MVLLESLTGAMGERADAVRVGEVWLSTADLGGAAAAVADRLTGASALAIRATASMETVVAVVGGLLAGVPVVPVPPDSGPAERAHVLRDSGADLLAGSPTEDAGALRDWAAEAKLDALPIDIEERSDSSFPEPSMASTALIIYTSGTTGAPKGVQLSRQAIATCLDGLAEAWAWTAADTLVHGLPLFHVHGLVLGVVGPLRVGSRLTHTVRPRPERYAAAGGTMYFGVPTVWSRLCDDPESARALASARLLVSGSAPLPIPVFDRLTELTGHRPVERYGMTETLITLTARHDEERLPGFVGGPIAGVSARVVSDDGDPVPADGESIGELQIRGSVLFSGYLHRADATTAAMTADGWFRTGDVATVDAAGRHRIVGRASMDLIKTGGYRVGAGEVENALLGYPGVRQAAVVGEEHADLGQEIVAYVVGDGLRENDLIEHVASQLSVHKRPRRILFRPDLPRNAMGKIQKNQLR